MPDRKFRFTHSSTSLVQIHIHTNQNSVFQTNKHTKKENPKGNGKKKEEKPLIARFSVGSQFLIFFSSVSLHHNMAWLSKFGMGWRWPAIRIFTRLQVFPFLCAVVLVGVFFFREKMSSGVWWQKMARVFFNCNVFFIFFFGFFFNIPKKQSNGVVVFKTI